MKPRLVPVCALSVAWLAAGLYAYCSRATPRALGERPAAWATPIKLPGLPNLHKVSDGLYRGAQPTAEGFRQLEKLGVKTVVNLRQNRSDKEELAPTSLALVEIPMSAWGAETDEAVRFLKVVTDNARAPVFVHCRHGADRTGAMCALYRIVVQGWTKDAAIREMTEGGFGHHVIFRSLSRFLRSLDVEAVRRRAGLGRLARAILGFPVLLTLWLRPRGEAPRRRWEEERVWRRLSNWDGEDLIDGGCGLSVVASGPPLADCEVLACKKRLILAGRGV